MVCDNSLEEFQYGHHNGYSANKNVSISANLSICWPDASHYFSSIELMLLG